jgi:YHS domain-containing protein
MQGKLRGEPETNFRETVCHRALTCAPGNYPCALYQGQVIYFCTETCIKAFLADPERFYLAHSRLPRGGEETLR